MNGATEAKEPIPISPQRAGMLVFFSILVVLIFGTLLRAMAESLWGPLQWNSPFLAIELLIVLPAVWAVRRHRLPFASAFRFHPVPLSTVAAAVLLGAGLAVIGDQLDRIIQSWFSVPQEYIDAIESLFRDAPPGDFYMMLVLATLGAGICEEMLFRGFFQKILEEHTRVWMAIFFPAALFGLIHFLPWMVLQITLMGTVLGLLAWRTQSVWPSVVVHATNNFLAVITIRWQSSEWDRLYLKGDFVNPPVVLFAIALFIFSLKFIWKRHPRNGGQNHRPWSDSERGT
jgi:membrane protease YdiL (CAAX protease family)